MRVLYYDCFAGISGDMNLGALLSLGADEAYVRAQLARLPLPEPYEIMVRPGEKMGVTGLHVEVVEQGHEHKHEHDHNHDHDHEHDHNHEHDHEHDHDHDHTHTHTHHHDHPHRRLAEMEDIIRRAALPPRVEERSLAVFHALAVAEARVHGKGPYDVTFHELSGLDTIIDIVGAALCLESLAVDEIWCSTIELGGGFVRCAHGLLPVPAPAVPYLLEGVPVSMGRAEKEMTTPTGAALMATLAGRFTTQPEMTLLGTGYGLGSRDLPIPNALRVCLGETNSGGSLEGAVERETQYMLETNIDDMNGEILSYAEERLFAAGALDVFRTAIVMKKGRLGVKLSVLARQSDVETLTGLIFTETTAIGLRKYAVDKVMLPRKETAIATEWGAVRGKESSLPGGGQRSKPEFEDMKQLAVEQELPLLEIYDGVKKNTITGADGFRPGSGGSAGTEKPGV